MSQSIRYPQEVTVKSQTEKVMKRVARYTEELRLISLILPIVERFEGKPLTKHIANAVQKEIGEQYNVSWVPQYGMFHLDIATGGYGKTGPYEKIMHCLMGYDSSPFVNIERIKERNKCYTLNSERLPKLKAGIKHIKNMVDARNEAIEKYQEVIKKAELYEMDYDFEIGKD